MSRIYSVFPANSPGDYSNQISSTRPRAPRYRNRLSSPSSRFQRSLSRFRATTARYPVHPSQPLHIVFASRKMHSESPSEFAQHQHNTPLSSPLAVSSLPSPLSGLQNASRDTPTSPLSIPDTTRSPSSTTTSTPHSPLTPVNSSPRSFRSSSSQQHHSDSHSLVSSSPLSVSSSGSMSPHTRLASGLGTTLFTASPARSRLNGLAEEFATPVIGSLHNILPNSLPIRAQLSDVSPGAGQPASSQEPPSEMQRQDVIGQPVKVYDFANSHAIAPASPSRMSNAHGGTTRIAHAPNSTATSAPIIPSSPLRSPIPTDSFGMRSSITRRSLTRG